MCPFAIIAAVIVCLIGLILFIIMGLGTLLMIGGLIWGIIHGFKKFDA